MRALREEGIRGYHLCTLNLEKSVTRVLEKLEWVTPASTAAAREARVRLSPRPSKSDTAEANQPAPF